MIINSRSSRVLSERNQIEKLKSKYLSDLTKHETASIKLASIKEKLDLNESKLYQKSLSLKKLHVKKLELKEMLKKLTQDIIDKKEILKGEYKANDEIVQKNMNDELKKKNFELQKEIVKKKEHLDEVVKKKSVLQNCVVALINRITCLCLYETGKMRERTQKLSVE
ncbi:hypothetical protein SteCoe_36578 [Stentor coeruleus]|uniref:Uncharacterized protein n=1 Tax=Stentor coeruleus TaxID=5963 RepID=A0A1R2AQ63_9CILI|nr:hypothetical protein SteCoe_36578 [Stentor coeruleus]